MVAMPMKGPQRRAQIHVAVIIMRTVDHESLVGKSSVLILIVHSLIIGPAFMRIALAGGRLGRDLAQENKAEIGLLRSRLCGTAERNGGYGFSDFYLLENCGCEDRAVDSIKSDFFGEDNWPTN